MSRPVLLVDIGTDALPIVTPVVLVPASWVPTVYVAPPPPMPTDLTAEPVADGVLLTWTRPAGRNIEFRIERAPDVAGVPGDWLQIGSAVDSRYTATLTDVHGFWFRVRSVRNGKYSAYTAAVFQYPYATNPPVQELRISNNTITIDCRYQRFTLLLDSDVFYVSYINVPEEKTIIIEVTQSGGDHVLQFPGWVQSVTGAPYKASTVAGATDVIGQITADKGVSWRMTFVQPEGGGSAYALTVTPNPAYGQVIYDGTTPVAPSMQIRAEPVNGVEPIICDWIRIDSFGGADFDVSDIASLEPVFSVPEGTSDYTSTQIWRVSIKDDINRVVQQLVTIRLQRVVALVNLSDGLLNANFDEGDTGWDLGESILIGTRYTYSGAYAAALATGFWGTSELINKFKANMAPNTKVRASCICHQGASDVGRTSGFVRVKFYNAANQQVGGNWDGNVVNDGRGGAWHPSTVTAVAPPGTAYARLAGVMTRTGQNYETNLDDFTWAVVS